MLKNGSITPKSSYVVADKGDETEKLKVQVRAPGAIPVIPREAAIIKEMMASTGGNLNIDTWLNTSLE